MTMTSVPGTAAMIPNTATATRGVVVESSINTALDELVAYVSVRSLGGTSVFSGNARISAESVSRFWSSPDDRNRAVSRLDELGFKVDGIDDVCIRIRGSSRMFTKKLGIRFERHETSALYLPTDQTAGNCLNMGAEFLEGVAFPQPLVLHGTRGRSGRPTSKRKPASRHRKNFTKHAAPLATSAHPPHLGYYHLNVPKDIVSALKVQPVHAEGNKGQHVRAAMIDSGFQWSHPYFQGRGYDLNVALPEGGDDDAEGHGTGESANLLAVAPKVKLYGLAMDDTILAFQKCRMLGVQIISNSWGSAVDTDGPMSSWAHYWSLVLAEIATCAANGISVLFSAGNGGISVTASSPDVISVGGVHLDQDGSLAATPYASSFESFRYPGQQIPHVCGLCGLPPKAIYIALPIPTGSRIDRAFGGSARFPNGDETTKTDGWGVFSGTSAACPMVAGVVALIMAKFPGASLADIKERLSRATDVTAGQSAQGYLAGPGRDLATGFGLVNAERACS